MPIFFFFLFLIFTSFALLYFWVQSRKTKTPLLEAPEEFNPEVSYEYIENRFVLEKSFDGLNLHQIEIEGEILARAKLSSIYLIHGSFVGDDPLGLIALFENSFPRVNQTLLKSLRLGVRETGNLIAKDLGNFIDEHLFLIQKITKNNIPVHNFTWSSANNHFARIKGTLELIDDLYQKQETNERILLIGHSHAGAIFALLTKLIHNPEFCQQIEKLLIRHHVKFEHLSEKLKKISLLYLDFVTLGTPARYDWYIGKRMRVLHFINHRGRSTKGGQIKGALMTKDGDYVQQWGIAGSDIKSPHSKEKLINAELDEFLGVGANLEVLKQNIAFRNRLHNYGHHLLVDYGDSARYPNFVKTAFGHGVYTKIEFLNFQLYMINKFFYSY